ncbi:hypothetical protein [Devosia sp. 2618]|uniref:hypothetical protein n=1 Tax=Devosia sp. 2618 TaxID=3156454 RepID=UPI00339A46BB
MQTISYKRRRAHMLKWAVALLLFAVVFTPKLDDLVFPDVGFSLITQAMAAE